VENFVDVDFFIGNRGKPFFQKKKKKKEKEEVHPHQTSFLKLLTVEPCKSREQVASNMEQGSID
jgi:hypothetical protein